jgi:Flp pilus assembly protein TadD
MVVEHDRLFREATVIIQGHIALDERQDVPSIEGALACNLKYAISLLERVLEINPENWSAMWFVGKTQQRLGNRNEALEWFARAYQINPSQPDVAREAALCAMEIGRQEMAIAFAYRATQIDPINPGLRANLALAYMLSGRLSDAATVIEQALAGDPRDSISKNIRAMVEHFVTTNSIPPTSTPDLLEYWRETREKGNKV